MTVLKTNLKRIFQRPVNIFFMVILPILLNLIIISLLSVPSRGSVIIVNQEQTKLTDIFQRTLEKEFDITNKSDIEEAMQDIQCGYADVMVVLPKGITEKTLNGNGIIQTYSKKNSEQSKPTLRYIETYISKINEIGFRCGGVNETFYNSIEKFESGKLEISFKHFGNNSSHLIDNTINSLGYIAIGMVYFISFATMLIFEDRKAGVYQKILATPLNLINYFVQHLLSYLLLAFAQVSVMFIVIPKLVEVQYGNNWREALLIFFLCIAFAADCIGIGIAISTFAKTTEMAGSLISMINVPMLMLGGCFWPRSIMPDKMQRVGNIMPTTWFLNASRLILEGKNTIEYTIWILQLIIFAIVMMGIAWFGSIQGVEK